jgi:DNA primase
MISFDSRDITNKTKTKYIACPEEREIINHKHILFGKQEKWGSTGICVEGTFDVFRLGFDAFATSGIKYTSKQLRLIAKTFKRVPIIFDDDPQAIEQADKLAADLRFRGVDSFRVDIPGDPGGMSEQEAKYLVKSLL